MQEEYGTLQVRGGTAGTEHMYIRTLMCHPGSATSRTQPGGL